MEFCLRLMSQCPRCHQSVEPQAITCPFCRTPLKAFGHPGIPLHRSTGEESLCMTCAYHDDDSCNFPQRPDARECTLYTDRAQPMVLPSVPKLPFSYQSWVRRNLKWLVLLGLILLSIAVTLLR